MIVLVRVLFVAVFSWAQEPPPTPVANKIENDINVVREQLSQQDLKQKKVLSALYGINNNLQRLVGNKGRLTEQRNMIDLEIEGLNKKIEENKAQADLQKSQLKERLRAIYMLGGPTLARFLFASKSSADLERNLKILGLVAQRDFDLIVGYQKSLKDFEFRRLKLAQKLANLKSVEESLKIQEERLHSQVVQKNKILAQLKKTKVFTLEKLKDLQNKSPAYDLADSGLMDMLLKPSFEMQRGFLPSPVQGLVLNQFGLVKQADQPYVLSNKGLLIAVPRGSPVHAVFGGVVSFVGSLPGLGKVLILDHGDHYYTVYGNNADVRVGVGQEVSQSQVIASSGRSSFEQQEGLYFEVRHFSEPYNPMEWVKGLSL